MFRKRRARSLSGRTSTSNTVIMLIMGGVFTVAGGAILVALCGWPVMQWSQAQQWVETPCQVVESSVERHHSDDGSTYSVHIVYTYAYDQREYTGSRYDFFSGSSSGQASKQAIVDRYPPGSSAVCYVDPNQPEEAVLTRAFRPSYVIGLFGLPFLLVGFGLIFAARPRLGGASPPRTVKAQTAVPKAPDRATLELRPTQSPWTRLIGISVFAALWNGMVSVFIWFALGDMGDDPSYGVLLFLTPFVLVGVGLIVGIFYYILALANPRVQVRLTPGAIPLGGVAELDWVVSGSVDRIKRFRIWIEGREEATYKQGTKTRTDTNAFEVIPVAEADQTFDIRLGRVQLGVPECTAHSFNAFHNKIRWVLRIHGEIERWPDVDEEYEILVLPRPLGG